VGIINVRMKTMSRDNQKKIETAIEMEGVVTLCNLEIEGNRDAERIDKILQKASPESMNRKMFNNLKRDLKKHATVSRRKEIRNQIVETGREVFARLLIDDTTYSGEINYGLLGDDTTAVSDSDTTLGNEVFRKTIGSRGRTDDTVTLDFYYAKNDTSGTFEEFGTVIDGNSSTDTGELFNRLLTGGWPKTSTESMTVSIQFNLNAA